MSIGGLALRAMCPAAHRPATSSPARGASITHLPIALSPASPKGFLDVGQVLVDHGAHLVHAAARGWDVERLAALLLRALGDWGERAGSDRLRPQPATRVVHNAEHVRIIR